MTDQTSKAKAPKTDPTDPLERAFSVARVDQFQRKPVSKWCAVSDIYRALSVDGRFALEVSFSTENGSEFSDPFLEVSFDAQSCFVRIVFQVNSNALTMEIHDNGSVLSSIQCAFDFSLFKLWRLWAVISEDGNFEVYFLDFALLSLNVNIQSVGTIWINTNTSVIPTFRPIIQFGYAAEAGLTRGTAILLCPGSDPVDELEIIDAAGRRVNVSSMAVRYISKYPVRYATLERTESVFLDVVMPERTVRIYNAEHAPSLDLRSGHIVLNVPTLIDTSKLFWSCENRECRADFRSALSNLGAATELVSAVKSCFLAFSEAFRLLSASEAVVVLTLEGLGHDTCLFQIRLSKKMWLALAGLMPNISPGEWKPSVGLSCLIVDLCHLLYSSNYAQVTMNVAPSLKSALIGCKDIVGGGLPVPVDFLAEPQQQLTSIEPSIHDVSIWKCQREVAQIFESERLDDEVLQEKIDDIFQSIPQPERNWSALAVSAFAVRHKFSHLLTKWVDDHFIWSTLNKPENTWEYSAIMPILAAKGEFGTCVVILQSLSEKTSRIDLDSMNIAAIAATFRQFNEARFSSDFRELFLRPVMRIVENFKSEEHTQFRNFDLQVAFSEYYELVKFDSFWNQNEFLKFLETQYGSIPEFWNIRRRSTVGTEIDYLRQKMESLQANSDKLVKFFSEITRSNLIEGHQVPKLFGRSYRSDYLRSVDALHNNHGRFHGSELIDIGGWPIRRFALPHGVGHPTASRQINKLDVTDAIRRLTGYPLHRYFHLLADAGRAVSCGAFLDLDYVVERICANEFESDLASEAVIIDVLAWLGKRHGQDQDPRISQIVQNKLDQTRSDRITPPGYTSASRRGIARFSPATNATPNGTNVPGKLTSLKSSNVDGSFYSDTIVAIVTCHANLSTHVRVCRETWVKDVQALGVRVIFFAGEPESDTSIFEEMPPDLVVLPVGDSYEDLPEKVLLMYHWLHANEEFSFIVKIDDDCYLDADSFFTSLSYRRAHYFGRPLFALPGTFNRRWHQARANRSVNQRAIDTSPLGSKYADGGGCYTLSRDAVEALLLIAQTDIGMQLRAASFFEDKLVGDLLSISGYELVSEGYSSAQKRSNFVGGIPVLQVDRTFYPSRLSGIAMAHLNGSREMVQISASKESGFLMPPRLFPLDREVSLDYHSNMLEPIGSGVDFARLDVAKHVCVSVFRNERKLLPHFLAHYRKLGIQYFLIVDNLSDDGTREYLSTQSDVAVFSAASDYSGSHYGVIWQRTLLDHFCIGKWVVVADADELLVTEGESCYSIAEQCDTLERSGYDAAIVVMVDMYPPGNLLSADFARVDLTAAAPCFDREPVSRWPYNRGPFGNFDSFVSSLRHRIMPHAAPQMFTSQKVALFRYSPLMSFSEGFHFGAGMNWGPQPLAFLHFKYSSDFVAKASNEVLRGQHFGNAVEYRLYLKLAQDNKMNFWISGISEYFSWEDSKPLFRLLGSLRV